MSEPTRRLGRGMSSLLPSTGTSKLSGQVETSEGRVPETGESAPSQLRYRLMRIPLEFVAPNPCQPRRAISESGIGRLGASIRENGLLQPIIVRPLAPESQFRQEGPENTQHTVKYELIAGERRWRAAKTAGLADLPAIVRQAGSQQMLELSLIENIQREDLNAIDRALAYQQFRDRFDLSAEQIGERVGEDRTTVTNYLRLLELSKAVQNLVSQNVLSMGHARALAGLRSAEEQLALAEATVRKGLSVRALEDVIRSRRQQGGGSSTTGSAKVKAKRPLIRDLERQFTQALKTRVTIQESGRKNRGKVIIEYNSVDDFQGICERLGIYAI